MASLGTIGALNFYNWLRTMSASSTRRVTEVANLSTALTSTASRTSLPSHITSIAPPRIPVPKLLQKQEIQAVIKEKNLRWATYSINGTIFVSSVPFNDARDSGQTIFQLLPDGVLEPFIFFQNVSFFVKFCYVKKDLYFCLAMMRPKNFPYVQDPNTKQRYESVPGCNLTHGSFLEDGDFPSELIRYALLEQVNLDNMLTLKAYNTHLVSLTIFPGDLKRLIADYLS